MSVLCDKKFPRALDALTERLTAEKPSGMVEAWLFEDASARRAAEARLHAAGVSARLRSAYKPLLCWFLEEVDRTTLRRVSIRYPVHPAAHPDRFLAETYPLVPLLPDAVVSLLPGGEDLVYDVVLTHADGRLGTYAVRAPNRMRGSTLTCCGWLSLPGQEGAALHSEFDTMFDMALDTVRAQDWRGPGPHFDRLTLDVRLPADDVAIGWGDEVLSLREAMHEDLFFSIKEHFAAAPGGSPADRAIRPGQVVPDIAAGAPHLRVTVATFAPPHDPEGDPVALDTAECPLDLAQVRTETSTIDGISFTARTREGRAVAGLYRRGTAPPVLISAAQHANETSGVVGALRAARRLAADPEAHFALVPVENVDGYALHQHLIAGNPRHMHHAARYTAWGDDLSPHAEPPGERAARVEALRLCGARLHINLHGYPAHEWTRPLSGYLPRGFEMWSMPKGFFLIVSHHAGWGEIGRMLLERVAEAVAQDAALTAFNRRQLAALRAHSTTQPFEVLHDIPCFIAQAATYATPVTLITEAPDETIFGAPFVLQHTTQMQAVLAAEAAWRDLAPLAPTAV